MGVQLGSRSLLILIVVECRVRRVRGQHHREGVGGVALQWYRSSYLIQAVIGKYLSVLGSQ